MRVALFALPGGLAAAAFGQEGRLYRLTPAGTPELAFGSEAPAALMALIAESISEPAVQADRFIEVPAGETVVIARVSGRGRASGMAINREQAHVWQFEGEQAKKMTVHGSPNEALRVLGLEEWPDC